MCSPISTLDSGTSIALLRAAYFTKVAARVSRSWEGEGVEERVAQAALNARAVAQIALEAVLADEDWLAASEDPVTRQARLAYAAWLLLLAGSEMHGRSSDLSRAAQLFRLAASIQGNK